MVNSSGTGYRKVADAWERLAVRPREVWIVGHEVVVSAKPMLVAGRYIIMSRFPIVKLADKFIGSASEYEADSFSVHIECHRLFADNFK